MSLINEALKKAQRVRTGDTVGSLASMPGGGSRVAKRSAPRTAQQLVLIAAGAIVLIVLSVVATVFLVNRPSDPKPAVAATLKLAGATPAAKTPTASPVIVVPLGAPVLLQLDRTEANGLWVAQDTGGAIKGVNRFDSFWGAGDEARTIAGGMSGRGKAWLLIPRSALDRLVEGHDGAAVTS